MIVVLNREAFVALLVNMPHSTGVIVSMIPHRVSAANPTHEPAHFAVDQRTQDKVVMVGHQLERKQFNFVNLKRFVKDSLKGCEIHHFVKDRYSQVAAVQGVVKSSRFVGARWSGHVCWSPRRESHRITQPTVPSKKPDPFVRSDPFVRLAKRLLTSFPRRPL